jgi:tryptophan 2,3-dioxygenase
MDPLNYGEYLKVKDLISLQVPQSDPPRHDEMLFIVVHQTSELWLNLLLSELDEVIVNFQVAAVDPEERDAVYEAARLLRRGTEIAGSLMGQLTVLETMLPVDFAAFRNRLGPAGGFPSEQFRELEFLWGLKDEKVLQMYEPAGEMYQRMLRRLREPSVRDAFFQAVANVLQIPEIAKGQSSLQGRAQAILRFYSDENAYRDWIDVCERLTDFDELLIAWRLRQVQMVERMMGVMTGAKTGAGGAETSHPRATHDKKIFPEFWLARTMLLDA